MYRYVGNNPTTFVDPWGLLCTAPVSDPSRSNGFPPADLMPELTGYPLPDPVKNPPVYSRSDPTPGPTGYPEPTPGSDDQGGFTPSNNGPQIHWNSNNGDNKKGGSKSNRDRDFGIKDSDFWKDWERYKQKTGAPDIGSRDDAQDWYDQWKQGPLW